METDYPDMNHFGCYFNYTKSLHAKIQDVGLATTYRENPNWKISLLTKIMALPFVPENEIMDPWREFLQDSQTAFSIQEYPALAEFLRYYHWTWLATFAMKMWNVFKRSSNLRTTNHWEGWSISWNAQNRRSTPNIWLAIRSVKIQEQNTKTVLSTWK